MASWIGSRMSGGDSWAIGRAVDELDHRVHDRLRVDDHVDAVPRDVEQLVGLDQLEPLVHQRRRVEGDDRPHGPGRVGERVGDGDVARARRRVRPRNGPPDWRSRTRRPTSLRRPPRRHWASAECSESTGMRWLLAAAGALGGGDDEVAADDQRLLVGERDRGAGLSAARVGPEPDGAGDAVDAPGRRRCRASSTTPASPVEHLEVRDGRLAASAAAAGRPGRRAGTPWASRLRRERRPVAAGGEPDDLEAIGVCRDDLQRLGADRPGRPEQHDAAAPDPGSPGRSRGPSAAPAPVRARSAATAAARPGRRRRRRRAAGSRSEGVAGEQLAAGRVGVAAAGVAQASRSRRDVRRARRTRGCAAFDGSFQRTPGVGFIGMTLTWARSRRAMAASAVGLLAVVVDVADQAPLDADAPVGAVAVAADRVLELGERVDAVDRDELVAQLVGRRRAG